MTSCSLWGHNAEAWPDLRHQHKGCPQHLFSVNRVVSMLWICYSWGKLP